MNLEQARRLILIEIMKQGILLTPETLSGVELLAKTLVRIKNSPRKVAKRKRTGRKRRSR